MKGIKDSCAVNFYYENGNRVKDSNGSYVASENQAATHNTIKPDYDNSLYPDVEIFATYNKLGVGLGEQNLKLYCKYESISLLPQILSHNLNTIYYINK